MPYDLISITRHAAVRSPSSVTSFSQNLHFIAVAVATLIDAGSFGGEAQGGEDAIIVKEEETRATVEARVATITGHHSK